MLIYPPVELGSGEKKCFNDTGGYLLTCSPDSVSNVKAKLRGWDTKQFSHIKAISTRAYASAEGQWRGYNIMGSNNHYIGYTPLHAILKGMKLLYSRNGYYKFGVGIAYMTGYFRKYFQQAPVIEDKEVLAYYREKRLKEVLCSKLKFQKGAR